MKNVNTKTTTVYVLQGGAEPLSLTLDSKDSRAKELTYWDEKKKLNRALRYAPNQKSPFIDEQDEGTARLEHIVFVDGKLTASPRQTVLNWFMSVHPDNKANGGSVFEVVDREAIALEENSFLDYQHNANVRVREMKIDALESIIRILKPHLVSGMDTAEIKRDAKIFARDYPVEFLEMCDDPEADLNNLIARAEEEGIIFKNSNNTEITIRVANQDDIIVRIPKSGNYHKVLSDYLLSNPDTFKGVERSVLVLS